MEIKTILVVGLGRIGLPQALLLSNAGFIVYGLDHSLINKDVFSKGKTPFFEPEMDNAFSQAYQKTFFPVSSFDELNDHLEKIDAVFFTIGTQIVNEMDLLKSSKFDYSKYYDLLDKFFSSKNKLKKGIKIIIRTTMPLGGTDQLKSYIEKKHFLKEGDDFFMAFVPERIAEGEAFKELRTIPVIIGVYSDSAFESISSLFKRNYNKIIRVKNPKTAEFCKLTDNSFRSTLFAYANEIAMHANANDIDGNEVITTVNDHYARNHIPKPGFVSGYCLSKDPYIFEYHFLENKRNRDFHSVWYYGRKTNDYLMTFAVSKILNHIKEVKDACIAVLGLSFNKDIDDFRVSHGISMIEMFIDSGVKRFHLYDPHINKNKYTQVPEKISPYVKFQSDTMTPDLFNNVDAIIICTEHRIMKDFNQTDLLVKLLNNVQKPCYLFDGWNVWSKAVDVSYIQYESIGYQDD